MQSPSSSGAGWQRRDLQLCFFEGEEKRRSPSAIGQMLWKGLCERCLLSMGRRSNRREKATKTSKTFICGYWKREIPRSGDEGGSHPSSDSCDHSPHLAGAGEAALYPSRDLGGGSPRRCFVDPGGLFLWTGENDVHGGFRIRHPFALRLITLRGLDGPDFCITTSRGKRSSV